MYWNWHPELTQSDSIDIERVQKAALHIILGNKYTSYSSALKTAQLDSLAARREALWLKFSKKAIKHEKHWFQMNKKTQVTRHKKNLALSCSCKDKESPEKSHKLFD